MTFYYDIIFKIIEYWLFGMAIFLPFFLALCKVAKRADKLAESLLENRSDPTDKLAKKLIGKQKCQKKENNVCMN
ncbi:MAG: hypothetical protein ACD_20C00239G0003 [uncultured bacterium]|nr:MAG: hypothetical protein ACD_20C00239G0003 [uncultured bacterium]